MASKLEPTKPPAVVSPSQLKMHEIVIDAKKVSCIIAASLEPREVLYEQNLGR